MSSMPEAPVRPEMASAANPLVATLNTLIAESPDFQGVVVVTRTGSIVATAGGPQELLLRLTPFAVGFLELGERLADEAGQGIFGSTIIESEEGHIGISACGEGHIVFALADDGAPLGVVRHDLMVVVDAITRQLS